MIQVVKNNELHRDGVRIGWIEKDAILDHTGKKVLYYSNTEVLDPMGSKIAYISGDYVIFPKSGTKVRIEDNNREVQGMVSDMCRAAIRLALG